MKPLDLTNGHVSLSAQRSTDRTGAVGGVEPDIAPRSAPCLVRAPASERRLQLADGCCGLADRLGCNFSLGQFANRGPPALRVADVVGALKGPAGIAAHPGRAFRACSKFTDCVGQCAGVVRHAQSRWRPSGRPALRLILECSRGTVEVSERVEVLATG